MQPYSLQGQTAIITGAADGLGFALAQKLVGEGVTTALFDIRADKLAQAQQELGPLSLSFYLDITDSQAVQAAVNQLLETRPSVQILVNCAGITGKTNLHSHEVNLDDYERVMAVNARGSLITTQAVLPNMLSQGYGRIVHVASIAGKEGNAGMTAYSMSKAAVIALTKVQGKEYAETGITINAIAPAVIRTEMVAAMPAAQVQYMTDKIPMKRCGTLEEFAHLAAFVVSPQASFTTGFTFDLTGGRATY